MVVKRIFSQSAGLRMCVTVWSHAMIWILIFSFLLPPSLLAQNLPAQSGVPGMMQQAGPGAAGGPFTPGGFNLPGQVGGLGQAIVTNPTALQPIVPTQTPCPTPPCVRPQFEGNGAQSK